MSDDIVMRAPTRIDFGGGWTDVPPYADEIGGYVCNVAISRYATVSVTRDAGQRVEATGTALAQSIVEAAARRFRLHDAQIDVHNDFPIAAGLGGSSAAGVAIIAALAEMRRIQMSLSAIAELSREIEIDDLGIAGGRQDHYAAAYGGALALRFSAGKVDVRTIPLSQRARGEIERRCIVAYTGQSRVSSDTINAVLDSYKKRDPKVLTALRMMSELAEQMAEVLATGNIDRLGWLVGEQWLHQRSLHPSIPTPLIDEIIAKAKGAGALGGKALGASGGGCVMVVARADRVDQVRNTVASLGELLPYTIDVSGVEQCH